MVKKDKVKIKQIGLYNQRFYLVVDIPEQYEQNGNGISKMCQENLETKHELEQYIGVTNIREAYMSLNSDDDTLTEVEVKDKLPIINLHSNDKVSIIDDMSNRLDVTYVVTEKDFKAANSEITSVDDVFTLRVNTYKLARLVYTLSKDSEMASMFLDNKELQFTDELSMVDWSIPKSELEQGIEEAARLTHQVKKGVEFRMGDLEEQATKLMTDFEKEVEKGTMSVALKEEYIKELYRISRNISKNLRLVKPKTLMVNVGLQLSIMQGWLAEVNRNLAFYAVILGYVSEETEGESAFEENKYNLHLATRLTRKIMNLVEYIRDLELK